MGGASSNPARAQLKQKDGGNTNSLSLLELAPPSSSVLGHQSSWFLAFGLQELNRAFGLNDTAGFPGSPTCRQQIVGFLSLHNHTSQFP